MQPKEYHATEHDLDSKLIDPDALFIMDKLRDAGYTAYLVGGSVRDLLVKKRPKDFDISTSASPEQVKQVFNRGCILIGRRFRLAHVRFGRKIFEVATFRSGESDSDLIVHDNQWGTSEEDALRRDFTINGLFYDHSSHSIIDFVGGWEDIHTHTLRCIGDPNVRFKQDPVRMLRLVKFIARFGFHIDPITEKALHACKEEITKSSSARVLEELLRMLESGYAAPFFKLMTQYGLLQHIFPELTRSLESKEGELIYKYLTSVDKICQNYPAGAVERTVLTSCLLYPILEQKIQHQVEKGNIPHIGDIMMETTGLIKEVISPSFSHFPRRMSTTIAFILSTQYRLTPFNRRKHHPIKLVHNKEFILALKFLKLRSIVDPKYAEDYATWKKYYRQHEHHGNRRPHPHTITPKAEVIPEL